MILDGAGIAQVHHVDSVADLPDALRASLARDHPLQRAWVEHHVPQCGYCQVGQLMAAASLLQRSPRANDDEIRRGMDGIRCRCGTYGRILSAIRSVRDG
jgi:aerobic-type carbon monoxide dehydrogenase small subunit (CoxS/CutS family)